MKPVEFEIEGLQNITYAKEQPEYKPLPCVKLPNGEIAICWKLDETERDLIWQNGEFYLCVSTFNQPLQPLMPMADKPCADTFEGKPYFYSQLGVNRLEGIADVKVLQDSGLPVGYRDAVHNDTDIHFSFWDRVKVLFGWKIRLNLRTFTQNVIGKCYSESEIRVYRLRKLPQGWGVAEAAPLEDKNAGN